MVSELQLQDEQEVEITVPRRVTPEYEEITPTGKAEVYQIRQCSAYGVSINN